MTDMIYPGEKHIACVVLVDASASMDGKPMQELNEGLLALGEALQEDSKAYGCADICVIRFHSAVETIVPFSPAANYTAPQLSAGGATAMNGAIIAGLDAIEARKQEYKRVGVDYWRPWMFLMTDGAPTDTEKEAEAYQRLQDALNHDKINFFPMGIGTDADISKLKSYTRGGCGVVFQARKEQFKEAFVWLSKSLTAIGNSNPGVDKVELPPMSSTITVAV